MRPTLRFLMVCGLLLAAPFSTHARMYQWVSSSSSVPQLSGEPPPWYRGEHGGPRVRVFENGNLVDDTAIALPRSQREELRTAAFREADERRRADALKRLVRAARQEERKREEAQRVAEARQRQEALPVTQEAPENTDEAPSQAATPEAQDVEINDDTVEQLKAIIAEFDRRGGRRKSN